MINSLYLSKGRHATWLELFFDLVFVAVIGVVTHDLAHTHDGHIGFEQIIRFPLVFIPVWWIWMTHTVYANRFDDDSRGHRLFSLAIMALLVVLSTQVTVSHESGFISLALLYSAIRLIQAYQYLDVHRQSDGEKPFVRGLSASIATGALVSAASALFDGPERFVLFYAGIAVDMIWQSSMRKQIESTPVDLPHLVERMGLLAIIILGESVIAMVASLENVHWDVFDVWAAVTGFLLIGAIWWIYFDSFPLLERAQRLTTGYVLIFSHLFLCMGLLILANMIRHAILGDLDRPTFGLFAVTGLSLFYLGKQIPYWYAFPPWRKAIISNTLVCVSITIASSFLPKIEYSLFGMMIGMLAYVYLTFRRILSVNVESYLAPH
ncbi:low temperature requirement protein A [Marinobacter xestospongiae]|uniref:low temperature requirement protein A n=1 Tax=Marinobacter xestospongiae TaxID=994319 RepID=UPI002003482D|nr:low temperature requirement protein A [Marinobacter xestospongiae]